MTVLERLASEPSPRLAEMIEPYRDDAGAEPDVPRLGPKFDNRPTWDNWKKKEPPWAKKTTYFKNR
jgi:hypothetical protein